MLTKPEEDVTAESVEKELADLEPSYKAAREQLKNLYLARRKKLRALLAVLVAESE